MIFHAQVDIAVVVATRSAVLFHDEQSSALLAAAVARRLHDLDETGLWGLMPLPFLAIDIVGFPRALSYFAQQIADPWLFAGLFANNILYLATLGALLAMLSRDGVPGPNRHGPVPGLWDFSPTA